MNNETNQIPFCINRDESFSIHNDVNIYSNCIRETYCGFDSSSNTIQNGEKNGKPNDDNGEIKINIFRYKFTDEFTSYLSVFSKIHQYDHRKDFKEAWKTWLEENVEIVEEETRKLKKLGYQGNVEDKMFKSARYYFRKKSTEKKAPAKRRDYVSVGKLLLEAMDTHIRMLINTEDYKPSDGFDSFCNKNKDLLKEEVNTLCKNGLTDSNEIKNKIKKTYKNRYFLFITK
jgi:hypothetical protein